MTRILLSLMTVLAMSGCGQHGGGGSGGLARQAPPQDRLLLVQDRSQEGIPADRETVRLVSEPSRSPPITYYGLYPKIRSADQDDPNFVRQATNLLTTQIELGQLAQGRASNSDVRRLSQFMITDHTQALTELRSVCFHRGLKMPEALDTFHQNLITRLTRLTGAHFDHEYIRTMLKEHDKYVTQFVNHSEGGYDPVLREFAAKALPAMREHWRLAKEIEPSVRESF